MRLAIYLLRIFILFFWFFGSLVYMAGMAVFPRYRFQIMTFYAKRTCPVALRILGIDLEIRHRERLDMGPCIFVPNHQHLWDGFICGALFRPRMIVVAKKSLRWIPIFGWVYRRCGNLYIDRSKNEKAIATMQDAHARIIQHGLSVLVMPEGTRSNGRGLLPFKKGAFHLALGTKLPLLPVAISSLHKELHQWRWHAGRVIVHVLPPIPTEGVARDDLPVLMSKTHAALKEAIDALDAELERARLSGP